VASLFSRVVFVHQTLLKKLRTNNKILLELDHKYSAPTRSVKRRTVCELKAALIDNEERLFVHPVDLLGY